MLTILAVCTLFFNSSISPGAPAIQTSGSPLLIGYQSIFGDNSTTSGFTWILIIGLIASFHSFIYCMGRLLFAIARDGFFPRIIGKIHSTRKTPNIALIVGSVLGYAVAIILNYSIGEQRLGSVLISLALIGAQISYALQLLAFLSLRKYKPELERPYTSPFGMIGAAVALVIVVLLFIALMITGVQDKDYLASLIGALVYFVLGILYLCTRMKEISVERD